MVTPKRIYLCAESVFYKDCWLKIIVPCRRARDSTTQENNPERVVGTKSGAIPTHILPPSRACETDREKKNSDPLSLTVGTRQWPQRQCQLKTMRPISTHTANVAPSMLHRQREQPFPPHDGSVTTTSEKSTTTSRDHWCGRPNRELGDTRSCRSRKHA